MTIPINIFTITRYRGKKEFNSAVRHSSENKMAKEIKEHEIESLYLFSCSIIKNDINIDDLDGFFYSFEIPQIGKEFDLLKINENICLNVELKSSEVDEIKIRNQLVSNRYYLSHLNRNIVLFTVNTCNMKCYKLADDDQLVPSSLYEIVKVIKSFKDYCTSIDDCFRAKDYLVSPLNTPNRYINGEYFLTNRQIEIKKNLLSKIEHDTESFFYITGKPGTGKTLLLYDIAKTLSQRGKTIIIHCGILPNEYKTIMREIDNINIIAAKELSYMNNLSEYVFVLVDETHRIYPSQFKLIYDTAIANNQVCIFSSDPEQVLSVFETNNNIDGTIASITGVNVYKINERIRTNKNVSSFIECVMDLKHKPKAKMDYSDIQLIYANDSNEAQNIIDYYVRKGYVFINYTKSRYYKGTFDDYDYDFDTHHIIGQEYDDVIMIMDSVFRYEKGKLEADEHPNPDYLYVKLFYQGVTRVRAKLAIVVVNAPELYQNLLSIFENE